MERLRLRGAGAEVVIVVSTVMEGSGRGGGDSPLSLLPTLGSIEAEDSDEQAEDTGDVVPP